MAQRNTVQQKIIAGQLAKLHGSHPTADEVYQSMKDEYPSISRATVYRNLNKMSDNGQALKVRVSSGADHFDDTLRPHYHVVCAKCGRVDDVEVDLHQGISRLQLWAVLARFASRWPRQCLHREHRHPGSIKASAGKRRMHQGLVHARDDRRFKSVLRLGARRIHTA